VSKSLTLPKDVHDGFLPVNKKRKEKEITPEKVRNGYELIMQEPTTGLIRPGDPVWSATPYSMLQLHNFSEGKHPARRKARLVEE
jgi:hypothetical protein